MALVSQVEKFSARGTSGLESLEKNERSTKASVLIYSRFAVRARVKWVVGGGSTGQLRGLSR